MDLPFPLLPARHVNGQACMKRLCMSIPAGTAICERGFSVVKNTKTCPRNRLRASTLTLLLTVQLHTAAVGCYDTERAIQQWLSNGHRKPNFMKKKPKNEEHADDDSDFSDLEHDLEEESGIESF